MTLPPLCAVFSLLCMNETYSMAVVSPTILNLSLPWQWCTVWDRVLHLPLCMVAFPVSSHVISTSVFMHAPLEYQDRFMHVHTGYRTHIDHIRSLSLTHSFQFDFIDNCVSDFSKIMFYMCILCYLLSINLNGRNIAFSHPSRWMHVGEVPMMFDPEYSMWHCSASNLSSGNVAF